MRRAWKWNPFLWIHLFKNNTKTHPRPSAISTSFFTHIPYCPLIIHLVFLVQFLTSTGWVSIALTGRKLLTVHYEFKFPAHIFLSITSTISFTHILFSHFSSSFPRSVSAGYRLGMDCANCAEVADNRLRIQNHRSRSSLAWFD